MTTFRHDSRLYIAFDRFTFFGSTTMSELIVLAFQSEEGAKQALSELANLQKQELITLSDAATVVRKQDGKVKVKQATSLVGAAWRVVRFGGC